MPVQIGQQVGEPQLTPAWRPGDAGHESPAGERKAAAEELVGKGDPPEVARYGQLQRDRLGVSADRLAHVTCRRGIIDQHRFRDFHRAGPRLQHDRVPADHQRIGIRDRIVDRELHFRPRSE